MRKFLPSRKASLSLVLISGLVALARLGVAVAMTFGLSSPLARNPAVMGLVLRRTLANDLSTLIGPVADWVDPSPVVFHDSSGLLRRSVALEEFSMSPAAPVAEGPEYQVIPGLLSADPSVVTDNTAPAPAPSHGPDWALPAGDDWGRRFSPLRRITSSNVESLRLVHEIDSEKLFGAGWEANSEAPPLNWGPLVYWTTADHRLVATDIVSGVVQWQLKLPVFRFVHRGFVLSPQADGPGATLFVPFGQFMAAVDARTGELAPVFGGDGIASVPGGTTVAPVVWNGKLLTATYEPQALVAIDIDSGRAEWQVPLHPAGRTFEGAAPWSGMAIDRERSLLFVTTGNPRPPLFGASRDGDNRNSSSVIAIDLRAKALKWAFQEVRHDVWDFDIPAAPQLTRIVTGGRSFDVVVAVTKIGNTLILDRESGRPIFDFRLRKAPPSRYALEHASPYQPDVEIPEPLIDIAFDASMVTQVSQQSRADVTRQIGGGRVLFGRFAPPELNRDVATFGLHGGAEWHGAAIDPDRGLMYVPVNMIPWLLRMYLHAAPDFDASDLPAGVDTSLYSSRCASCHQATRNGEYVNVGEVATRFVPSLNGFTLDPSLRSAFLEADFQQRHSGVSVTQADLDALWALFEIWDRELFARGRPSLWYHWRQMVDRQGLPGSVPPWGKMVALNLATGRKVWEVPLGDKTVGGHTMPTGSPIYGGLVASAGGLVFVTGTDDNYLRAIDASTGATRWKFRMAAAGSAPPITFEYGGKQYVCVIASGGRFHNFVDRASRLYVFSS